MSKSEAPQLELKLSFATGASPINLQTLDRAFWRLFPVGAHTYYVKSVFTDTSYALMITDLVRVWFRISDEDSVSSEKQQFNPLLDTKLPAVLKRLKQYLRKPDNHAVTYDAVLHNLPGNKQALTLRLSAKIEFYNFSWSFVCAPLETDQHPLYLRDNFVFPLLAVNQELCRELQQLKDLLAAKDIEIDAYKNKNVKIPKAYVTPKFDPQAFDELMLNSKELRDNLKQPRAQLPKAVKRIYKVYANEKYGPEEVLLDEAEDEDHARAASPPASPPSQHASAPAASGKVNPLASSNPRNSRPPISEEPASLSQPHDSQSQHSAPQPQPIRTSKNTETNSAGSKGNSSQPPSGSSQESAFDPAGEYHETADEIRRREAMEKKLKQELEKKQQKTAKKRKTFV